MASGTELFNAWKEALANKDSSRLAEFFTEDFRFVGATTGRNETKQEILDWLASDPNSISLDNLEVLYENAYITVPATIHRWRSYRRLHQEGRQIISVQSCPNGYLIRIR